MSDAPDELTRRRPEMRPGTPLRLLDGAVWTLADPVLRHHILTGPGGPVPVPYLDLGPLPDGLIQYELTVENAMKGVAAAKETGGVDENWDFYTAMASAAASRLRANYDLTPIEAGGLLVPGIRFADMETARVVCAGVVDLVNKDFAVMANATGRAFWSHHNVGEN